MHLPAERIEAYRTQGFISPIDAFSPEEIGGWRRAFEDFEREHRPLAGTPMQFRPHLHQGWASEIVRRPEILDPVEDLIGPNILVYHLTIWIKEAHSAAYVSWHQDSTYFGLTPFEHVTAWVALTDASEAMGCVRVIPGSHQRGELPLSEVRPSERLMLRAGHRIEVDEAAESVEHIALRAGQFSLHHTLTLHASGPNDTGQRRIGLGISYIPTHCRCTAGQRVDATLVRGDDTFEHFDHERPFDAHDIDTGRAQHARSLQRWNEMRKETQASALARLITS